MGATTVDGERYDVKTGEVLGRACPDCGGKGERRGATCMLCGGTGADPEPTEALSPRGRRPKREPTAEELAAREERKAWKLAKLRALEVLSPALPLPGETVNEQDGVIDITRAVELVPALLRLPRASGKGGPGSSLVVSYRSYDGMGGGEAKTYAVLFAEFLSGSGFKCRTRGVAVRPEELRDVAVALAKLADELDAKGG